MSCSLNVQLAAMDVLREYTRHELDCAFPRCLSRRHVLRTSYVLRGNCLAMRHERIGLRDYSWAGTGGKEVRELEGNVAIPPA